MRALNLALGLKCRMGSRKRGLGLTADNQMML